MLQLIKSLYINTDDAAALTNGDADMSPQAAFFEKAYTQEFGALTWQFSDEWHETTDDLNNSFARCYYAEVYAQALPLLSIDAWTDTEPHSWTWNDQHKAGHVPAHLEHATNRQILKYFRESGYLKHDSQGRAAIERDDYYLTIVERATARPLYAIELNQE